MKRFLVAAGSLAVATVVAVTGTATPAHAGGVRDVVLSQGHADVIGVEFEDGELELHVHDEENDAEHDPNDVTIRVLPDAETTVPAPAEYRFLGDAGDPVWILPQFEDPDLLFAGPAAEEVELGELVDDQVRISLGVVGPGDAALYIEDELGLPSQILVDTGDSALNTFTLPAGAHIHANWAFSEPGDYYWLVTATAREADTSTFVTSGLSLYHFQVQD